MAYGNQGYDEERIAGDKGGKREVNVGKTDLER